MIVNLTQVQRTAWRVGWTVAGSVARVCVGPARPAAARPVVDALSASRGCCRPGRQLLPTIASFVLTPGRKMRKVRNKGKNR